MRFNGECREVLRVCCEISGVPDLFESPLSIGKAWSNEHGFVRNARVSINSFYQHTEFSEVVQGQICLWTSVVTL